MKGESTENENKEYVSRVRDGVGGVYRKEQSLAVFLKSEKMSRWVQRGE